MISIPINKNCKDCQQNNIIVCKKYIVSNLMWYLLNKNHIHLHNISSYKHYLSSIPLYNTSIVDFNNYYTISMKHKTDCRKQLIHNSRLLLHTLIHIIHNTALWSMFNNMAPHSKNNCSSQLKETSQNNTHIACQNNFNINLFIFT